MSPEVHWRVDDRLRSLPEPSEKLHKHNFWVRKMRSRKRSNLSIVYNFLHNGFFFSHLRGWLSPLVLYVITVRKPYSTSYKYSRTFKTSINTGLFNSQNITLLNHLNNPEINMIIKSILRSTGETNKQKSSDFN